MPAPIPLASWHPASEGSKAPGGARGPSAQPNAAETRLNSGNRRYRLTFNRPPRPPRVRTLSCIEYIRTLPAEYTGDDAENHSVLNRNLGTSRRHYRFFVVEN